MNWDALAAIGEIVGALGVVSSLLYLAIQIRADARARRAAVIHEQSEAYSTYLRLVASDPDLSAVYFRGIHDFNSLERGDLVRFSAMLGHLFRIYEDNLFQLNDGVLDARVWQGLAGPVNDLLAYPGVRAWWQTRRHHYSPDLQSHIEQKLGERRVPRLYGEPAAQQDASADEPQRVPIDR